MIVGAGPAGSIAARTLVRRGLRVLMVDRGRFDRPHIGETAPPELAAVLTELDLGHVLAENCHCSSPAVASAWGTHTPSERHHILSPYGSGWHLDRVLFDASLAAAARDAGADLRLGTQVGLTLAGSHYELGNSSGRLGRSRRLILATGRSGGTMGLPCRRVWIDRLVGISALIPTSNPCSEPRTLIESVREGWIYSALLPSRMRIVVLMTDNRLVPADRATRLGWWQGIVGRSVQMRALVHAAPALELSTHDARSSFLVPHSGRSWLPAGDARFAVDPLAGQGIIRAIDDGLWAADALLQDADCETRPAVELRTMAELGAYLASRDTYYGMERRWPEAPFWASGGGACRPCDVTAARSRPRR